jgi:hypothetical protein
MVVRLLGKLRTRLGLWASRVTPYEWVVKSLRTSPFVVAH